MVLLANDVRSNSPRRPRVLAISSGGGHWVQLLRLRPAWDGCDVAYATVSLVYAPQVAPHRFYRIPDATQWNKLGLLWLALRVLLILVRERPDVVVSTGAAPGYLALRIGRWFRARTVWVDSIANAEVLSLAGQMAGRVADLWLTQWPDVARPGGPHYRGATL